jgi:SAM-dependent methyltransferase
MDATPLTAFAEKLSAVKSGFESLDFAWYPHSTLAGLIHLEKLVGVPITTFFEETCPGRKILDIGCMDGDLAFFLESLGYEVTVVDHPAYSHNGMRGLRTLKTALGSSVRILETDLDRQFVLPMERWDLASMLGVLYHLRNPFYVLEELAKRAHRCVLSTRVARCFPGGERMPKRVAMAYLLEELELNNDETNYFIFSQTGLRVLLKRAYWNVDRAITVGRKRSEPVRKDRDERFFCLMTSMYGELANVELGDGWYEIEGSGWRWTRKSFGLHGRIRRPGVQRHTLSMQVFVPSDLLERFGPIHLAIVADGRTLPEAVFDRPGLHDLIRHFDCGGESVEIQFHASHALAGDETDGRERALIVASVAVE